MPSKSSPRSVIVRFAARRTLPGAILWGAIFGITVITSAYGFIEAFTTPAARAGIAESFGNNIGLKVILGLPHHIDTMAGFTEWRALGVGVLIGAVWALMHATKLLRGDEDEGRWELLLSGVTSQRRAVVQALAGMGLGVAAMCAATFIMCVLANRIDGIHFSLTQAALLSLALASTPAMCLAAGALASQIAATRRQAVMLAVGFLGISFFLRVLADATTGHDWLRDISPLGWLEQVQPLTGPHVVWFLPVLGLLAVLCGLAVFLAGRRDLGAGYLKETSSRKARTLMLGGPWGLTLRLTQLSFLGWLVGLSFLSFGFGTVAKSAAQAFADSQTVSTIVHTLTSSLTTGASTFMSIVFLILMLLAMLMATGSLGGIREEEASGHLDNLLVRPVSRFSWLLGRFVITTGALLLTGLAIGFFSWVSVHAQGLDINLKDLLYAGINVVVPAFFILGLGTLVFGLAPRLVGTLSYGYVSLAFLIEFLAAALNVPGWVLNLSILHHMALAPSVSPDWHADLIIAGTAIVAAAVGAFFFGRRDIAAE